jgi:hypothetical protein
MKESNFKYEEYTFDSFSSIMNYVKDHSVQFFMLILVFIIIFIVDQISNINAILFGVPSAIHNTQQIDNTKKNKAIKKIKNKK